ncbi:TIGR03084 family protein [Paractinoplanes deccanensis]|uniref:TIGR03084 family protein n=1 Tax=Paractinoplanes deccanensis TaxID=113561 RepID=A0ABQ3YH23_9ACTN|nr:maleylpyruvate isomerase family mycothiol-dependent enzyme [Actinoplanes deccanensis]GID79288.1 TIGR03084 family protein [Actinoplanes deccanensis]
MPDVIDDLEAEQDQLESVLLKLTPADWTAPSAAAGWTVADVVLHLAQTEEAVTATTSGHPSALDWHRYGPTVDEAMDAMVRAERAGHVEVFHRWQTARRASVQALRAADPRRPVRWVTGSLKPRTLATTRLAEHWAHALDVTTALALDYPDTARLRHIAWLGHSTLPYAFRLAGLPPADVFCDLTAPDGTSWQYGPHDAASAIAGPAAAFCRVGARRLSPADSGLATTGPHAATALTVLRNYADV